MKDFDMTHRALIQQMLETLELHRHDNNSAIAEEKYHEACYAAREYLAESEGRTAPEQSEPTCSRDGGCDCGTPHPCCDHYVEPDQQPKAPEPVNQQLLGSCKKLLGYAENWPCSFTVYDCWKKDAADAHAAIAAAEQAPQPTELTDDEIWAIDGHFGRIKFARAVLAAQRSKK